MPKWKRKEYHKLLESALEKQWKPICDEIKREVGLDELEKSQKKSLNIKENSTASISKNSAETNIIKFLNLYKETIEIIYGQKIENDFEINFSFFLLILYKIGFTNKNYSSLIEMSYETDTKKMETMHPSVISDISLSNSSSANV